MKDYNKLRRATYRHSLFESRSIFNASWWLELSNVTGCFTACIDAHPHPMKIVIYRGGLMWGDFFHVGGNEKIFGCWGDSTHSPSRGNSDFITQFFLEILQRHCILILNTLGMPSHTNQKYYQFIDNCDARLHEKSTSFLTSFFRYYKDFANFLFWVIWAGLAIPTKINGINL